MGWDLEDRPNFFGKVRQAMIDDYEANYKLQIVLRLRPNGQEWFQSQINHWFNPAKAIRRSTIGGHMMQRRSTMLTHVDRARRSTLLGSVKPLEMEGGLVSVVPPGDDNLGSKVQPSKVTIITPFTEG